MRLGIPSPAAAWLVLALATAGCHSVLVTQTEVGLGFTHSVVVSQAMAEMERARSGPDVKDAAPLAPQELAHAEELRAHSIRALKDKDATSADLYAESAVVAYERTVVLARLARATEAEGVARTKLAVELAQAETLATAKVPFEKEASVLANDLAVAREALTPAHVGPADPQRERARLVAARSLAAEAHLLCGAARLVARGTTAPAEGYDPAVLDAADRDDAMLLTELAKPSPKGVASPIETAAHARLMCLNALTHARRKLGGPLSGDADALLSALSSHGGWDPSRDERGVVVTLRNAFKGTALAPDAEHQLLDLGHVAAAHAGFPLQVVIHDATAPGDGEKKGDTSRAQAALAALTAGGASVTQSNAETMGTALPTADPSDPVARVRNARLEVVFVSRGD